MNRVDNNILKLDSLKDSTAQALNKPCCNYSVATVVEQLKSLKGNFILQTMFLRGECDGKKIDNTTEEEISLWLQAVALLSPKSVMVYSIARDTPCKTLQKVEKEELETIANRVRGLGVECSVA